MKKIIPIFILIFTSILTFTSCYNVLPEAKAFVDVDFYVDGELYHSQEVFIGQNASMPTAPQKENHVFLGWYTGGTNPYEFDFSKDIYSGIELHANFAIDTIKVSQLVNDKVMKSTVTVQSKCYNTIIGGIVQTDVFTAQGSGVVFEVSNGYCYVLTNCHVAKLQDGFENQEITVVDAWGNEYEASVYKNLNSDHAAISEEYDLALLQFKYQPQSSERAISGISLASSDAQAGEFVASLGTPNGLYNTVSYGKLLGYDKVNMLDKENSNVEFEVAYHSARIKHGSSGGALINMKGELIGINFGGNSDGSIGCTIPISKVREFMDIYVYLR